MNRGWRFCRFNGVVNRVVSCCLVLVFGLSSSPVLPAVWAVLDYIWTTKGPRHSPAEPYCRYAVSATLIVNPGRRLRQLDERLPSLERSNNGRQLCVEPFPQLCATSIANSDPHHRRPVMQDAMHREVLVRPQDHRSGFRSGRANRIAWRPARGPTQRRVQPGAERFEAACQRGRELSVESPDK